MNRHFSSIVLTMVVSACSGPQTTQLPPPAPAGTTAAVETGADVAAIARAIADPARFSSDRAEDAWRQPAVVLGLLQARPGMHVIDAFAAGGYYSELLARIVDPTGKGIACAP